MSSVRRPPTTESSPARAPEAPPAATPAAAATARNCPSPRSSHHPAARPAGRPAASRFHRPASPHGRTPRAPPDLTGEPHPIAHPDRCRPRQPAHLAPFTACVRPRPQQAVAPASALQPGDRTFRRVDHRATTQQSTTQVSAKGPVQSRWNSTGRTRRTFPGLFGSCPQPLRLLEYLHQTLGDIGLTTAPPMPVAGQPSQIRHDHRIRNTDVRELPPHRRTGPLNRGERFRGPLVDIVLGTDIDHAGAAIGQPYEVVGRVPPLLFRLAPVEPERL